MAATHARGRTGVLYAVTILTSAFLIFQVQPLISKSILPWFGGTPGVWTTCMLFFQVVLFGGYAYAHASIRWLTPRWQAAVHLALLAASLALLPMSPDESWKPSGDEPPTLRILGLLAMTVGLPYFLLSATGPLLQAWFGTVWPGASPYRLYALSNLGSVLGLVTYPFLFEPWLSSEVQAWWWSAGFGVFVAVCSACAVNLMLRAGTTADEGSEVGATEPGPNWSTVGAWFGLSACASVMLLATTNQVCLDVAVIPFLWVVPLTLYLASFILCFDREWWYPRRTYAAAFLGAIVCLTALFQEASDASLAAQVVVHFTALFFCCMVCHGELVRLRPSPRHLTAFYLASSGGGAMGGVLVGVIAPLATSSYIELPLALLAGCVIVIWVFLSDREFLWAGRVPRWTWACVALAGWSGVRLAGAAAASGGPQELESSRNFYGLLRIVDTDADDPDRATRRMVHGRIVHGLQFLAPEKRGIPTAYYGEKSGIGRLLLAEETSSRPRRIGMVGLGVGTLAAYGRPGDVFRFYEINPDVVRMAREHFTYLRDCAATVEMVVGDARLSLEREPPQQFDVLVLDAFSSDAIPTHLLTEEAFAIYRRQLRPDGVLAIHVTNRHFDLEPVVRGAAEHFGMTAAKIHAETIAERAQARCDWMLVAGSEVPFRFSLIQEAISATRQGDRPAVLWTDRYNHMVGVLK